MSNSQSGMRIKHLLLVCFLGIQFGLPLSYYMGDDIYDERFAWRMFSPIRMVKCKVDFTQIRDGKRQNIKLTKEISQPWEGWLKRGHQRVAHAYINQKCEGLAPDDRLMGEIVCRLPDGKMDVVLREKENLCMR